MAEGSLTGFFLCAPSTLAVGVEFSLGVKLLTEPYYVGEGCYIQIPALKGRFNLSPRGIRFMDNVLPEFDGRILIEGGNGYEGPRRFSFRGASGVNPGDTRPIVRIKGLRFATPGVKFICVAEPESGLTALSNPIEVTEETPSERLYWGDLHSQSFFSDGLRCPEELYCFARDEAFLDIFALSDHIEHLTQRQWDYFTAVTNDFNRDHSFVTLVGLEWTCRKFGHRNIYYPDSAGPAVRSRRPREGELSYLYDVALRYGALVIPHHSANVEMGVNWGLGHCAEVERLAEIHSVWGNSECPASEGNPYPITVHSGEKSGQHIVDALKLGCRFGLIGGGDIHDGRPGDELHRFQEKPEMYRRLSGQGIMGVWAQRLTRAAIFSALWNRRCFASMNVRPIIRFHLNDYPMGSEVSCNRRRRLSLAAHSESPLTLVELIRNGSVIHFWEPGECSLTVQVEDDGENELDWYYVRLRRRDGNLAWSSPIWVSS